MKSLSAEPPAMGARPIEPCAEVGPVDVAGVDGDAVEGLAAPGTVMKILVAAEAPSRLARPIVPDPLLAQ